MISLIVLKKFFDLVKVNQKPYEDFLRAAMQEKVDWIKKYSTYNLNERQKQAIEKDKVLIKATEKYISIQHEVIAHLFGKLEQSITEIEMLKQDAAGLLSDKLATEQKLIDYIKTHRQNEGDIQSAA